MAAMATALLGMGAQAAGTIQESRAKADAMEYNASVAANDAMLAEKSKQIELHKHKTATRNLLARQNAVIASSGRDYSGSPLDVLARSEAAAMLDESIIRMNATMKVSKLEGQSIMDRGAASATVGFGKSRATAKLLSSSGKFGLKYQDRQKTKAKDD